MITDILRKMGLLQTMRQGGQWPEGWLTFGRLSDGMSRRSWLLAFRLPFFWQSERMDVLRCRWVRGWVSPMVIVSWDMELRIRCLVREHGEQLLGPTRAEEVLPAEPKPRDRWEWLTPKEDMQRRMPGLDLSDFQKDALRTMDRFMLPKIKFPALLRDGREREEVFFCDSTPRGHEISDWAKRYKLDLSHPMCREAILPMPEVHKVSFRDATKSRPRPVPGLDFDPIAEVNARAREALLSKDLFRFGVGGRVVERDGDAITTMDLDEVSIVPEKPTPPRSRYGHWICTAAEGKGEQGG